MLNLVAGKMERKMSRFLGTCIGVLLASAFCVSPVWAADQVKVALLDMSSIMPVGMMNYSMMGPGMMGMMAQSQRGANPGGYYGMMGAGMMGMMGGMMSIRTDKLSVKTGTVTFDVTNWSRSVLHEMLVVSVDNPAAPLPYDYVKAIVPKEQVKVLGEVADLQPNMSKELEVNLMPGSYLLICNLPGHFGAGMATQFNVLP